MPSKIATYLQNHLQGEVFTTSGIRQQFSTDNSALEIIPQTVVYPRSTNDIRKVARFSWQLAEKGHTLPITPRGFGGDTTGAAIGQGAIISFPSHMGRILELDTKQRLARVQPGLSVDSLQETLHTHGLCFFPLPAKLPYTTIGGAIANGTGYVSRMSDRIQNYVDKLEVVLADGEVIQTGRISRRELEKKKGLPTLEGEIYRGVDGLVSDYSEAITKYYETTGATLQDNVGYRLGELIDKNGSCDLTPLFIGSQGTLGIITEIIIKLKDYAPTTRYIIAAYDNLAESVEAARSCSEVDPASIQLLSRALIADVTKERGNGALEALLGENVPHSAYICIVELQKTSRKSLFSNPAKTLLKKLSQGALSSVTVESGDYEKVDSLRSYAQAPRYMESAGKAAVPAVAGCMVPIANLDSFLAQVEQLLKKHHVSEAWSCDVLSGVVDAWPLFEISKVGGRQKIVTLMSDYFNAVWAHGGTIAGYDSDGRMKALYGSRQLGPEMCEAMKDLKKICDPHEMLNPGVKTGVDSKRLVSLFRKNYSIAEHTDTII